MNSNNIQDAMNSIITDSDYKQLNYYIKLLNTSYNGACVSK